MSNENILSDKEIKIVLGGAEYKVKPLPISKLISIWSTIQKLEGLKDAKNPVTIEILKDMVHIAYVGLTASGAKNLTEDQVGEMVDLVDLQTIIGAMVGQKNIKGIVGK